tara:strand:+ start:477 stop:710 length:234 start_codon:yes stop_codon:yes gene_type:complete
MKNTAQKGVSFWIQGKRRNNQGKTISILIAERLEILFHKNIPDQIKAAVKPMLKFRATRTPNKVEIPFPPLNLRKTE